MDLYSTQIGPDDKKNMVRNFCLCVFFKTWLGLFHCLYMYTLTVILIFGIALQFK
jgi:hypothetical protein